MLYTPRGIRTAMSQNKITITISLAGKADPTNVGIAMAKLIQALTPAEEWETVAQEMKAQVETQLEAAGSGDINHPLDEDEWEAKQFHEYQMEEGETAAAMGNPYKFR